MRKRTFLAGVMKSTSNVLSRGARVFPATTDVWWLAIALFIKQILAVEYMSWFLKPGGYWIGMSTAVLFALLVLILPQRGRPWVSLGVNAGLSAMLFGDIIYVRYFNDLPSFALMNASHQTFQVTDSVAMLIMNSDWFLFADLLPMAIVAFCISKRAPWKWTRPLTAVVCLALLGPWIRWSWDAATADVGISVQRFSNLRIVANSGMLAYHLLDTIDVARDTLWGWSVTEEDFQFVLNTLEERRPQRAGAGQFFGAAQGMNLVMIQIESMDGPVVGLEVDGQEVTPTLNRLTRENLYLSLCLDQTARGRTSDAELLTQASLLPAEKGAAVFLHAGNDLIGLADVLSEHTYQTAVGVAHEAGFWNRRYSHPAFGFSQGWYENDFKRRPRVGWGLNDRDFLRQAADRITDLDQPFFAFLLTLALHHPFTNFPEEFQILDLGSVENESMRGYLHAMRWADEAIGGFLENLDEAGLTDSTMVVIWGDHDSSLIRTPNGVRTMGLPYSEPKGLLYDRVPVIIRVPGVEGLDGTIDFPTGLSDLPPTIAALLGIDPQDLPWLGRNILGSPADEPIIWGVNGWVDRSRVHRTANPLGCWDRTTGKKVSDEMCSEGLEQALKMRRVGTLILEGDLQQRLGSALSEGS